MGRGDRRAQRRHHAAAVVAHGGGDGADGAFVEAFAEHMAALAVGLDQVEQVQHRARRLGRVRFQVLLGIERAQLGQGQVGQQHAAQGRGMGGQARAHTHRTGQRRGRRDLGHVDDGAAIAHHDVAGVADLAAQPRDHGLAQLGQVHGRQELEAQAQHGQAQPVVIAALGTLQKAHGLQRVEHAENRGARQLQAARQLGRAQRGIAAPELLQQAQAALQRGHHVLVGAVVRALGALGIPGRGGVVHGEPLQFMTKPPLTGSTCPVTKRAPSDSA